MESGLPGEVIEFAEKHKLDAYFINAIIETAAQLIKEGTDENFLFPTMVLSSTGKEQKASITEEINQLMNNNQKIREEYNLPATEADFERVPQNIRARFPKDTKGWKVKDIAINTRWLLYFDKISLDPLVPMVDKIIKIFRPQILELSKSN